MDRPSPLIPPLHRLALCLCLLMPSFTMPAAADAEETQIPAGWDLSATLAFFRNLPFLDVEGFPATSGPVLSRFSEAENETDTTRSFSNTYEFFRKTQDGSYLLLLIQETSRNDAPEDPTQPLLEVVADSRQEIATLPTLPPDAIERPEISRLLAYVLDHREPLVASEAGQLARGLNYTPAGKVRPGNYTQPRVTFLHSGDAISKIRVYGLEALLTEDGPSSLDDTPALGNRVLELSVNAAGAAEVALVPLATEDSDAL